MALNNVKRDDLAIPYQHVPVPKSSSMTTNMSDIFNQSMPLAAMFLKNKFIGWFALVQSFHFYLNTDCTPSNAKAPSSATETTPFVRLILSVIGLVASYMDLVFPVASPPIPAVESLAEESN